MNHLAKGWERCAGAAARQAGAHSPSRSMATRAGCKHSVKASSDGKANPLTVGKTRGWARWRIIQWG
jgi:hypothetical protein